jgi:predicted nucleic acid-binding protein
MRRVGILDRIHRSFPLKLRQDTDKTKLYVDLQDTAPHFIIFATGVITSLCVFIVRKYTAYFAHLKH